LFVVESEDAVVENRPSTREVRLMAIWAETPAISVGALGSDSGDAEGERKGAAPGMEV
jgi:hypothetical protein